MCLMIRLLHCCMLHFVCGLCAAQLYVLPKTKAQGRLCACFIQKFMFRGP